MYSLLNMSHYRTNKGGKKKKITICVIKNQIQTQIMFLNMFYSIH